MDMDADVVIAGAGPVGLMVAAELRLRGVTVVVVDPLEEPSAFGKAFGLNSRSTETMGLRGLIGPLLLAAEARPARQFGTMSFFGGAAPGAGARAGAGDKGGGGAMPRGGGINRAHFAGIRTIRLDELETGHPGLLPVSQEVVESVLAERAVALGARIRRGAAVVGVDQDSAGVTVRTDGSAGGGLLRASYLVGCDGGRSAVRKLAGFGFPGTAPTITGRLVEASIPALSEQPGVGWHRTRGGIAQILPGRVITVEFDGAPQDRDRDRDQPVTETEMLDSIRRVTGREVSFAGTPTWLTRFTDDTRLADAYRSGRVLLAGDSAHVHSPFGGQGLNLGLQDAANLGWKLAAEIAGRAPAGLLDSYESERRPVAARVLHNTRAQVALMNPDPNMTPLREIFAELMETDEVNHYLGRMLSSLAVRYDVACGHPMAGGFAPRELSAALGIGAAGVGEVFGPGRAVVVVLTDSPKFGEAAAQWVADDRVDVHSRIAGDELSEACSAEAVLVRPDGYVAWAGDDPAELTMALEKWFGAAKH